ncbi:MAG: superinfection immunity protein [Opitutales bacterium]|nr:superinfection immunity protein [Opitutales bacterium]
MTDDELAFVVFTIVVCIVGLIIFLLPTIIAFFRGHHYKWIILAVNVFGSSILGVGWLVALVWACWPRETGVADVVLNDPTTNSSNANKKIYSRYGENIRSVNMASAGTPSLPPVGGFCPHCGKPSQGGAFCAFCGRKL